MFEWEPYILILYATQKEEPDMIDEYELDVEDVEIDDDNGQGEDEDDKGLNIME